METRANYTIIGLFTVAVIAAAFIFVYWLARYDDIGQRQTMRVIVPGAVTGLAKGGQVLFNGIKVGEVSALSIAPDDPNKVIVEASVDAKAPIKADTKASLGVNPLTGVAYIQLAGGSASAPNILVGPGMPTLIGDRESFADLLSGAQSAISKIDRAMDRINNFVDKAEPSLTASIANVQTFTGALAKNSEGVGELLENVARLSNTIEGVSGKLEGLIDHTDMLVTAVDPAKVTATVDSVQQLAQRLNSASTRIDSLLGKAEDMMTTEGGKNFFQEASEAAASIKRVAEAFEASAPRIASGLDKFSNRGLGDLTALIADARQTLARFDRIVASFEQNPQQLIFGGNSGVREYNRK